MSPQVRAGGTVLVSIFSVQCGAAVATTLFDHVGPAGAVLLRTFFCALILAAVWRPRLRATPRPALRLAAVFGLTFTVMNFSFYGALDRLPLGIAVTLEFTGPLAVAVLGSRRRLDLLWVAAAALGIVLLSGGLGGEGGLDSLGVALALLAGVAWGSYILLAVRINEAFSRGTGLALAMVFSTLLLLPPGIAGGGMDLLDVSVLAAGLAVGLLSSVIPYTIELEALKRLPASTFGVLMSLEPAVAALIGFVALSQDLSAMELGGIALVVIASAGALREAAAPAPRDV
jgi:inner membrane transporter RhtA